MLEFLKRLLRKQALRKNAAGGKTGITPLGDVRSAVAFIDVEDPSWESCKNALMAFFRDKGIKGDIFFFDFRKLSEGERLITSIATTVLKKDLNWYGKPSQEKVDLMLRGEPDLFLSLLASDAFPIEYMARCSRARFKVGRIQLPGEVFDLVVREPDGKACSQLDIFREMSDILERIQ